MAETPEDREPIKGAWRSTRAAVQPALFRWEVALVAIVLVGALLRFHGLGWDQHADADFPLQMHPDERFLSIVSSGADWPDSVDGYFDTDTSPLNPYNIEGVNAYVYGTFPLYLQKGLATLADRGFFAPFEWIGVEIPDGDPPGAHNSYDQAVVWGRALTATFDTLTILLVFSLGAALFSRGVGLLGALGYALAVLPIQLAHFFTMDPYVTFFATATALASVMAVTARTWRASLTWAVLIGISVGLLLASKPSALTLVPIPVLAAAARIGMRDFPRLALQWRGIRERIPGNWANDIAWLMLALFIGACVFRVAQPYAFVTPDFGSGPMDFLRGAFGIFDINPQWRADLERESEFQRGDVDFPPFVQFADYSPFITPVWHMVVWGFGPLLGVAGLVGTAGAAVMMFKRRELAFAIPLAVAAITFGFYGMRFVAFMRYFMPMYPILALFAAWGAVALWHYACAFAPNQPVFPSEVRPAGWRARIPVRVRGFHVRWAVATTATIVVLATAWWALAFQNVYVETHPRIQASEWIYENVPPGSAITGEIWDDTVPYNLPGRSAGDYRFVMLEMYRPDSVDKIRDLVYGAPDTEGGGLDGADYVAVTSNRVRDSVAKLEREYPATIRYYELLDAGELGFERVATFKVHPSFLGISINDSNAEEAFTVYDHPEVRIYEKTAAWDADRAFELISEARPEQAVNLLPRQGASNGLQFTAEEAEIQQGGGTFSDVFSRDSVTSQPAWLWWFLLLQVAALATVPWLTWMFRALPDRGYGLSKVVGLASMGLATWFIVAWDGAHFSRGLVWMVLLGLVLAGVLVGVLRRGTLLDDLRGSWKAWVLTEAVFVFAFFAFLLLRAYNPDVWHHPQGGEKPMEMAYMTAVARSTILPPFDPWFGGGTMNYYYMGWFLLAVPMRALQIVPEIAFNLGVATYAGLAASVAASTAYNLVAISSVRGAISGTASRVELRPALITGVVGAILLVGIGNLDGGHQTIERFQAVNQWGLLEGVPVLGGAVGIVGGVYAWLFDGAQLPGFDWWRSSRVHLGTFDITEFPFWTFLFADLHPHLMGLPFFGLTIAAGVGYVMTAVRGLRAQAWALAVMLGLCLGLVRTVHTWDFPTAVLIVSTAIVTGQLLTTGRWQDRWWTCLAHLAIAAGVLTVAFLPYTERFEVFNTGLQRAPETTMANQYFAHFGLFVVAAVAFIAVRYHEELRRRDFDAGRNLPMMVVAGGWEVVSLLAFTTGLIALSWQFGLTTIVLSVLIVAFLANLLWLEWRAPARDTGRLLATAMFVAAFCIAAGVDVVTVQDDIVRMNTVFKFSLQAWQLFAIGSAYAAWYVGRALWDVDDWRLRMREGRRSAAVAAAIAGSFVVVASVIFLFSGTEARQERRFASTSPTLDGLVFLEHGIFHVDQNTSGTGQDEFIELGAERPIIDWMRENVEGSPVIAEMVGPLYQWTGRISMLTGLPSVIGWDWHQTQQRWDYSHLIQERRRETDQFFRDPNVEQAERYLRKYNVRFVVVGPTEYAYAGPDGLAKFEEMDALDAVFEDGDYAIYEVDQAALPVPRP